MRTGDPHGGDPGAPQNPVGAAETYSRPIMQIRLLAVLLLVLLAVYAWRRLAPRLARDPRLRGLLSGVGVQLLRLYLLRTALPFALRALRWFRFLRFFR